MDKKILIALGLISAFSIDNASGMNGIIENPSVNESQSMKTINDFSYDLRSLGPVNRLFDLTYWSPQKWQEALHEVSEVVDFYWTHPDADMSASITMFYSLFIYSNHSIRFTNSSICNNKLLDVLTKIYCMAPRVIIGAEEHYEACLHYQVFINDIETEGLRTALEKNKVDNTNTYLLVTSIAYSIHPICTKCNSQYCDCIP